MKSRTNIVLVHGAWADGSSWGKVIPFLQQKGFNVTAAQIPLTSLVDDIVVTRNLLAAQKGPTVLAGHSYAGVVISGAANDAPNVKALVYIAAFGLDECESIDALSKQGPAPAGAAAVRPPAARKGCRAQSEHPLHSCTSSWASHSRACVPMKGRRSPRRPAVSRSKKGETYG